MSRIVRASTLALSLFVWSLAALSLSTPSPAGASTAPPTVNATTFTQGTIPSSGSGATNTLESVSCTTATFCMATGQTGAANGALIEKWDGTSWSVVSNPPIVGSLNLKGVSCVGTTFCAAVGGIGGGVVIEQWNGTAWSQATAPTLPPATSDSVLNGVTCLTSTNCTAVGDSVSIAGTVPLVEQWNGSTWSTVTSPAPSGATSSTFDGVSCGGPQFCAATGSTQTGGLTTTLVEQWNGSTWSIVTSPNGSTASGASNTLAGVSCVGASFCQAVGNFSDGVNSGRTFAAQWNGSTWASVTTPNVSPTQSDQLMGVDCFSPTTCSAVGENIDPSIGFGPLAQVWNGSTWSTATVPSLPSGTVQTAPVGVSCLTDWECVAVGGTNVGGTVAPYVLSAPIARSGYRFVASDGGVFAYGSGAPFLGSSGGTHLNSPIVGMAVMPAGDGYDLVAADGGIFNYGSAPFDGSAGSIHLNQPIVGMAMTPDGGGYWLVASDGGIFSYGDAQFYGSTGNLRLNKPIVGMASTPDGKGYWLVASDGGIFNYGDAGFMGSAGNLVLNKPVVGMAAPVAGGYYLVATDGGIFSYPTTGGPPFEGSTGNLVLNKPIVGMTAVAGGYYLTASDGGVFTFPTTGTPPFLGSTGNIVLNKPIVGMSG
ncbi:MAG: hypothetical protein WAL61_06870 [Acidimicrobiales bacterium]